MASQASYSAGYFQALDDLMNFRENILDAGQISTKTPEADYGALQTLVDSGEITKEEADALRTGSTPDYSKFTKRNEPRAAGSGNGAPSATGNIPEGGSAASRSPIPTATSETDPTSRTGGSTIRTGPAK